MFDEIFVKRFPGFLSVRNSKHEIVYLNEMFRNWIKKYTDLEPLGMTNGEIAKKCSANVADVFYQCHDTTIEWMSHYGINESLKKMIVFEEEGEKKYLEVVKYGFYIREEKYIFTVSYDVTEIFSKLIETHETYMQKIENIAFVDPITGGNTLEKFKILSQEKLLRNKEMTYAILKVDIANFKLVNHKYSFKIGNLIIKIISDSLLNLIDEKIESYGRIGADEFVLLLRYDSFEKQEIRYKEALDFINKKLKEYSFNFKIRAGRYIIPVSDLEMLDINSIIEKVNVAHYNAKLESSIKVVDYNEDIRMRMLRENELEHRMMQSLELQEFQLYLQPKYSLCDEKIVGAEALVRWHTSDKEMIYPNEFIPIFEKNGFIMKLDMYMLTKACEQIKTWLSMGVPPINISVNISRLHLFSEHFIRDVCKICDEYSVEHQFIEFELTENLMLEEFSLINKFAKNIRKNNFLISIDDFGTGYSSLAMLGENSFDGIKIDRAFFNDAYNDERKRLLLKNIFNLASDLNMFTVAEGVEDKYHIDMLKSLGCNLIQGYYYAKPMPAEDLTLLLA